MTDYAIIHADEQIALADKAIAEKTAQRIEYAGYVAEFAETRPDIAVIYSRWIRKFDADILYFSETKQAAEAVKQKRRGA
jgi:hypothetical protein